SWRLAFSLAITAIITAPVPPSESDTDRPMTTLLLPTVRARPLWHWRPTTQGVITALLLLFCGGLVGYPIAYLVLESLHTGDSQEFPPESLGLDNYLNLIDDSPILTNTALV